MCSFGAPSGTDSHTPHHRIEPIENPVLDVICVRSRKAIEDHATNGFIASLLKNASRRDIAHHIVAVCCHN
jgi:hypothetical protein